MFRRTIHSALAAVWCCAYGVGAQEPQPEPAPAPLSRAAVRDRQLDVALEARDIERILTRLKRASELSKTRITEAATVSEAVSTDLDKGDSSAARQDAEQAAAMFREIVRLLEALLAEETPQRVAAARNLAAQLSRMERQFAQQIQRLQPPSTNGSGQAPSQTPMRMNTPRRGQGTTPSQTEPDKPQEPRAGQGGRSSKDEQPRAQPADNSGPATSKPEPQDAPDPKGSGGEAKPDDKKSPREGAGSGNEDRPRDESPVPQGRGAGKPLTDEERRAALAQRAAELAASGETLLDILQAIAASTEPADREAVAKVNALLKETNLADAVGAMKRAAAQVQNRQDDDARLSALDVADRMIIATQRLDAAYRTIVAPQAEELRRLEELLAKMNLKLNDLQTPSQVNAWQRELRELLNRAEDLGISPKVREALLDEMQKSGLGPGNDLSRLNWELVNGRYVPPEGYVVKLLDVQEEIQARIQGLLLGDVLSAADDAAPPKYQGLVERYYEVLSRDGKPNPTPNALRPSANPAAGKKEQP